MNRIKDKFITFLIFLLLLYSFVPYEIISSNITIGIRLGIISVLTVFICLIVRIRTNIYIIIVFLLIFLCAIINSLISTSLYIFLFLASITSCFIIANAIIYNHFFKLLFANALKWLLLVSIMMLFLQIIIFKFTGNILELHNIFFPYSHARVQLIENLDLFRFGGMYIEPGTYSNYMYTFLILYMILNRGKDNLILFVGAISIILTVSVYGIIFGTYFLILLTFKHLNKYSLKKIFIFISLLVILIGVVVQKIQETNIYKFIQVKLQFKSMSGYSKMELINNFKEKYTDYIYLGEGFDNIIGQGIISPQDAGLFINLMIKFGILFALLIVITCILFFILNRKWTLLLCFLPILLSKLFYWDFAFWLLYFVVLGLKNEDRRNYIYFKKSYFDTTQSS